MKNILLKNILLGAMALALAVSVLPVTSVFAQEGDQPKREVTPEKLEQAWARQLKIYEKLGKLFSNSDTLFQKVQSRIDKAKTNGKDVSAIQAALDAFEAAVKDAKPVYQSMNGIVTSHQGFDGSGKLTDQTKAVETVKQFHEKMQDLRAKLNGTGKALRQAIKAFREANKPSGTP